MTSEQRFDVVVLGAGMAGLACAGTLVNRGLRPLLIAETAEVGWNLRAIDVDGNRGYVQHPMWSVAWGGGWWYRLARELGANVKFKVAPPVDLWIKGAAPSKVSVCTSASAVTDLFAAMSPIPLGEARADIERVVANALAIPYQELIAMDEVPIAKWLHDQGADPILQLLILTFGANICETTTQVAAEHLSAFGVWGMARSLICGEGPVVCPEPDPWEGLMKPLAVAIEAKGGTIWRGRKASHVVVEDSRAVGVELADGTIGYGDAVAVATGTSRVGKVVHNPGAEVIAAIEHARSLAGEDVCTYTVLDKPVCNIDTYTMLSDTDGSAMAFLFPMHKLTPDHVQPGKQFVAAQGFYTPEQFSALGGTDGAVARLNAIQEELFPGYTEATVTQKIQNHKHHWLGPLLFGPRLPSRDPQIAGLWYAGDGSRPVGGLGVEAAASAGMIRGEAIADDLAARPVAAQQ